jgi:hypothetical protein
MPAAAGAPKLAPNTGDQHTALTRMSSAEVELLLTGLAAMLSPTTLTFSVLALVLAERPRRTGALFYAGAFGATLLVGILAAYVLGDAAASPHTSQPKDVGRGADRWRGSRRARIRGPTRRSSARARQGGADGRPDERPRRLAVDRGSRGGRRARQTGIHPDRPQGHLTAEPSAGGFIVRWLVLRSSHCYPWG